jgi:hypothetical protein
MYIAHPEITRALADDRRRDLLASAEAFRNAVFAADAHRGSRTRPNLEAAPPRPSLWLRLRTTRRQARRTIHSRLASSRRERRNARELRRVLATAPAPLRHELILMAQRDNVSYV